MMNLLLLLCLLVKLCILHFNSLEFEFLFEGSLLQEVDLLMLLLVEISMLSQLLLYLIAHLASKAQRPNTLVHVN